MGMPPFKIDGSRATLRYVGRDDRKKVVSGRRTYLIGRVVTDALLTGWGRDFEVRLRPDGPWHRLTLTADEVAAELMRTPLGRRRLARLRKRADYCGPLR